MSKKESEEKEDSMSKQFLETRTIVISGSVDSKLADKVIKQTLLLEQLDSGKEIIVIINSPGGEVYSGLAMFDIFKFVECPICTIVSGLAASMGSILSLVGDDGRRLAFPNAKIMIHQPLLQRAEGQTTDLEIHSRQIMKLRQETAELYAAVTGKEVKKILKDMDRDNWMTAKESLKYGLIDKIISSRSDL